MRGRGVFHSISHIERKNPYHHTVKTSYPLLMLFRNDQSITSDMRISIYRQRIQRYTQ
jgi:hypothetical protein